MRRRLPIFAGITALVLLAVLFVQAVRMDRAGYSQTGGNSFAGGNPLPGGSSTVSVGTSDPADGQAGLLFDSQELVYDGSGSLDLLAGVTAADTDGSDITDQVNAVLTGRGSGNRKVIRYSVFTSGGKELTGQRTLVLKNYRGPQLTVSGTLSLQAEDLMDLASVLRDRGELSADDGYGRDPPPPPRRRGGGPRPSSPLMLVAQAGSSEGNNDLMDRVQVENYVNAEIPGSYSVVYTLTSLDNTQQARAILRVTVTGGTS